MEYFPFQESLTPLIMEPGKPLLLLLLSASPLLCAGFTCTSNGYFADLEDCSKFYQCHAGTAYHKSCPPGLVWDQKGQNCNWPSIAKCSSTGAPPTLAPPPTPAPATPPPPATPAPTSAPTSTPTPSDGGSGSAEGIRSLPGKVMGVYLAINADGDGEWNTHKDWTPQLHSYQQSAANVLYLCFINPSTMEVPKSFANMAATRGSGAQGAVPSNTVVLFSVGGLTDSVNVNPWPWLTSRQAAEQMAGQVAKWPEMYPGCDGIDLDIEEGAGNAPGVDTNIVYFVKKLRQLNPSMIINQPAFGYPQIDAENAVINESWDSNGKSNNLADSIGLMVYTPEADSLNWIDEYTESGSKWVGFPITADVPESAVIIGVKGTDPSWVWTKLANEVNSRDLRGMMTWYATVANGPQLYDPSWDVSKSSSAQSSIQSAFNIMRK